MEEKLFLHLDDMEEDITWEQIHDACDELREVMDGMIGQEEFVSFRPGIAQAIAKARDNHQVVEEKALLLHFTETSEKEAPMEEDEKESLLLHFTTMPALD